MNERLDNVKKMAMRVAGENRECGEVHDILSLHDALLLIEKAFYEGKASANEGLRDRLFKQLT